eukprot:s745_g6.t1
MTNAGEVEQWTVAQHILSSIYARIADQEDRARLQRLLTLPAVSGPRGTLSSSGRPVGFAQRPRPPILGSPHLRSGDRAWHQRLLQESYSGRAGAAVLKGEEMLQVVLSSGVCAGTWASTDGPSPWPSSPSSVFLIVLATVCYGLARAHNDDAEPTWFGGVRHDGHARICCAQGLRNRRSCCCLDDRCDTTMDAEGPSCRLEAGKGGQKMCRAGRI